MKALLLAAGLGTRLRPITLQTPKCLLPIAGKALLEYHFESLSKAGINDVLINTHYLANQVNEFVANYHLAHPDFNIVLAHEPVLLGSAGTLKANQRYLENEVNFLVVYADVLNNIDYRQIVNFHLKNKSICTIATYHEDRIEQKGMVVVDEQGRIIAFKEKPKTEEIVSHQANAGIYVMGRDIFKFLSRISGPELIDFGHDVFPDLLKNREKIYAYKMKEYLLDIGNPESYVLAQSFVSKF